MGFFDSLKGHMDRAVERAYERKERAYEKKDRDMADKIRRNAHRVSDEGLLQSYADFCERTEGTNIGSRTREALRRELRHRGYDDLDD